MEKQKTAVEWLLDNLSVAVPQVKKYKLLESLAKQMEKEQMKQIMWDLTDVDMTKTNKGLVIDNMFKKYYKETYEKDE